MKVTLSGDDFRKLVRGEIVRVSDLKGNQRGIQKEVTVEICLADIGFGVMRSAVDEAMKGTEVDTGEGSNGT